METKKKNRSVLRAGFTRCANELEQLLVAEEADPQSVSVVWEMLQRKNEALEEVDNEIYSLLLEDGTISELDLLAEMDAIDGYRKRFIDIKLRRMEFDKQSVGAGSSLEVDDGNAEQRSVANSVVSGSTVIGKRKFKLPTIELKKFGGDIKDWLPFWAQFRKVHEDSEIDASDKISYLIQVTIPGSRARQLVESFPAIQENYGKIVEALVSRFGRDDLQIEVYVRELLKLILNNAMSR
ncbi:uncharacterized protein LOC112904264, partial [Agrilus planipennis]|uniref:Uncharacterized protein LOC112904264 n=1 Tax=Agrilus planipennis TaxID=224129 RepID=A0A7F5R2N7_AGRPL